MILNYLGHENLSGARHRRFAGRGGAPEQETNEKGEIREISEGDAGHVWVGTTRPCTDDQK